MYTFKVLILKGVDIEANCFEFTVQSSLPLGAP